MGQPYIGEIRIFGGNFPPSGWAFCDGQLLAIADNDTLYNLIGTTYGGDGQNTFGVPDLRGRVPVHMGTQSGATYTQGEAAGVESVTLIPQQLPQHTHALNAVSAPGDVSVPTTQTYFSDMGPANAPLFTYTPYNAANAQVTLASASVSAAGGNQPHENMQPYLGLNFIISLYGVYPSQN